MKLVYCLSNLDFSGPTHVKYLEFRNSAPRPGGLDTRKSNFGIYIALIDTGY